MFYIFVWNDEQATRIDLLGYWFSFLPLLAFGNVVSFIANFAAVVVALFVCKSWTLKIQRAGVFIAATILSLYAFGAVVGTVTLHGH